MKLYLRSLFVLAFVIVGVVLWLRDSQTAESTGRPAASPSVAGADAAPTGPTVSVDELQSDAPSDASSVSSERSEAPTEVAKPERESRATLRVRVVAKETGAPLPGWNVAALALPQREHTPLEIVKGRRAAIGEAAVTDDEGRAELEVQANAAHRVESHGSNDEFRSDIRVEVGPLEPGAVRDVELFVPTRSDSSFFGRVVDAQSRAPLAGARARVEGAGEGTDGVVTADHEGVFELRFRSWADRFARVDVEGYAWAVAALDKAHATRADALELALGRTATLEVLVLDGGRPVPDARVMLTTESYRMQTVRDMRSLYMGEDPRWKSMSGLDGLARIEGLPPDVPLALSVSANGRDKTQAEPISLAPGELRRIEVGLGSGALIRGRVETSAGEPLADVEMWRLVARMEPRVLIDSHEQAVEKVRSNSDGRFEFKDVAPGAWWIGVAPRKPARRGAEKNSSIAYAPIVELVKVVHNGDTLEVVVRTDANLFLRGKVLDPAGAGAQSFVSAISTDGSLWASEMSSDAGEFAIGPLPAGDYRLKAQSLGHFGGKKTAGGAPSEELLAQAGATDIVLQLRPGASIPVRVIGPDGEPFDANLHVSSPDADFGFMSSSTQDARGLFSGLAPGAYAVSASAANGLFAMRAGIDVRAGETAPEVELRLERGATLRVRYEGPKSALGYGVYVNGDAVDLDGFERGAVGTLNAPAGEVEVRSTVRPGETPEVLRLTLEPGEVREIVVGK